MNPKLFAKLSQIEAVSTAHLIGIKKVFLSNSDSQSSLTQFAYGELAAGEKIETHLHPTMEECFFFIAGSGLFFINDEQFVVEKDVFIHVPANTPHNMESNGHEPLSFVYFGVAL